MKYLLVVCVVAAVLWLMLRPRKAQRSAAARSASPPQGAQAQPMVQCQHCGVHLPRGEALVDARGTFCSQAHRLAGPRAG